MTTHPCPADALDVPDVRTCDARGEIDRCRRIVAWLLSLDPRGLARSEPPQDNDDLISVVVPMFNAVDWIDLCLTGLLAQTHANQEIFCVDDASDDGTFERVLERFASDRRICAVRLRRNVGPYQIKNWVAARLARGEWLALQDADDVSHPLRLAAQRDWLGKGGIAVGGTCTHQFFPAGAELAAGRGAPVAADGALHNLAYFPTVERVVDASDPPVETRQRAGVDFWQRCRRGPYKVYSHMLADHGTQMIRRSVLLDFGGFDGDTRVAADSDFNNRLIRFLPIGNLPQVLYSRRFHARSLTQDPTTGLRSALRQAYRARRAVRDARIRAALAQGDLAAARSLSTADLSFADVEVAEIRGSFALPEQLARKGL